MPRLPIIPTIMVAAAVATMIALGIWQLGRAEEKEALIARYEASAELPAIANLEPRLEGEVNSQGKWTILENALFRRVEVSCEEPINWKGVAGRNAGGQSGYAHRFECDRFSIGFMDGTEIEAVLFATVGWSRSPQQPVWQGGRVKGILATAGDDYQVVASEPIGGLAPLAKPDPRDLPNNHLAYAGQWFFFAMTALVIYVLALRRRRRTSLE